MTYDLNRINRERQRQGKRRLTSAQASRIAHAAGTNHNDLADFLIATTVISVASSSTSSDTRADTPSFVAGGGDFGGGGSSDSGGGGGGSD